MEATGYRRLTARVRSMKRIYSAWGPEDDDYPNTLIEGAGPPRFGNGDVDSDCPKRFWTIEAGSFEEASATYHLRMGFEPYKPMGPASPCPKCGALMYPKGSGQCWACDGN